MVSRPKPHPCFVTRLFTSMVITQQRSNKIDAGDYNIHRMNIQGFSSTTRYHRRVSTSVYSVIAPIGWMDHNVSNMSTATESNRKLTSFGYKRNIIGWQTLITWRSFVCTRHFDRFQIHFEWSEIDSFPRDRATSNEMLVRRWMRLSNKMVTGTVPVRWRLTKYTNRRKWYDMGYTRRTKTNKRNEK